MPVILARENPSKIEAENWFSKSGIADSTTSGITLININGVLTGSATAMQVSTGAHVWNGADFLSIVPKLIDGASHFTNSQTDCRIRGYIRDFYGA